MPRSRSILVATGTVIVAYGAAATTVAKLPGADADGKAVLGYFRDHGSDIRWGALFGTIATAALLVLVGLLRDRLPAPYGNVFFGGGIALAAQTAVGSWFTAGLALHARTLEPATARVLLDVSLYYGPVLTATTIAMIGATAVFAWRGGLPRWFAVVATVALVEQTVEMITLFGKSGFTEPGGAMNLQLGAGLTLVWVVALSWVLSARRAADVEPVSLRHA